MKNFFIILVCLILGYSLFFLIVLPRQFSQVR
jgi:hypothetical protein